MLLVRQTTAPYISIKHIQRIKYLIRTYSPIHLLTYSLFLTCNIMLTRIIQDWVPKAGEGVINILPPPIKRILKNKI